MKLGLGGLNLKKAAEVNQDKKDYATESDIHKDLSITLNLPDGSTLPLTLKSGETVQNIKKLLNDKHSLPFGKLILTYEGKVMMDPLSLNDYAGIVEKGEGTFVVSLKE
eukprot:TRINITY_DN2164_c0_g1_i1.p1 TRINITY_DN2164_c0_g1~~TRINITY_DN2164_c0_g1_i1.p1  ORF type:complete len:109 (-),score=23.79 TRINITY_DN2164_c0_g1_i1:100-426(-)